MGPRNRFPSIPCVRGHGRRGIDRGCIRITERRCGPAPCGTREFSPHVRCVRRERATSRREVGNI